MKNIHQTQLSELFISPRDIKIYERMLKKRQLGLEYLQELYTLNLLMSKEMYLIIYQMEKLFKYKVHHKMITLFGHENWFNMIEWSEEVLHILENKACAVPEPITPENFWDSLPLNFLKHLFDHEYVHTIYHGGVETLFDNYPKRLRLCRSYLKRIIIRAVLLKNSLIFGNVIINETKELLRDYRKFMQFIYWLDKDYFFMTARLSSFIKYYRMLDKLKGDVNTL